MRARMREIGVDEAGKGPVIGSMFVAGVLNFEGLEGLGVRDSKKVSPKRRELLAGQIEAATEVRVVELTASEIDESRKRQTLNETMVELFSAVISCFQPPPDRAFVDAADVNPARFAANIRACCERRGRERAEARQGGEAGQGGEAERGLEIISESKADERYPVVSAASIIAKLRRDRSIRLLEAELGAEIGSGYPADPKTVQFLRGLLNGAGEEIPPYVRHSWKTVKTLSSTNSSFQQRLKEWL